MSGFVAQLVEHLTGVPNAAGEILRSAAFLIKTLYKLLVCNKLNKAYMENKN